MPQHSNYSIRSFMLVIYDANFQELARYQVPVGVASPFGNRLAREVLGLSDEGQSVREPWYTLAPRYHTDPPLVRSLLPEGPTSLYGERYDPEAETGPPIRMHPNAYLRYFEVRLFEFETELFHGHYSVDDVFLHGAHHVLQQRILKGELPGDRGPYFYAVLPSTRAVYRLATDLVPEDAYQVEGMFHLPPRAKDEPRVRFKPVPEPPPPQRDPASFGPAESRGQGDPQAGRVFIPRRLYTELSNRLTLSEKNEEGGYVLGNVYRLPGSPEKDDDPNYRWLVEVTDLLMAENTVGTPVALLFTGDTWSKVNIRRDRDFAGRKLVGWFHTHLFPASDTFGLSGLDQDMHGWYLSRPWQVAILLNLEQGMDRTVRCYQRGPEGALVETPYEVIEDERA
jgi:hypothetical protein